MSVSHRVAWKISSEFSKCSLGRLKSLFVKKRGKNICFGVVDSDMTVTVNMTFNYLIYNRTRRLIMSS